MDKTAILVRCRTVGPIERDLARVIRDDTGISPVLVVNEARADAEQDGFATLALTRDRLAGLGFAGLPDDWAWRCGDLCLYLARNALPKADRHLLIENDVLFLGQALRRLVDLARHPAAEAGAVRLGLHDEAPKYSRGLDRLGLDPRAGCLFPVVFATAALIDRMAGIRQQALALGLRRLNDEAVLAGAALRHPATALDLARALPRDFRPRTFATNPPLLREALLRTRPEGAHHPVLPLAQVLDRIADPSRGYGRHRLRRVLADAAADERAQIAAALDRAESPAG